MQSNNNKVSPIVAIAAASVILFSAVGIGVMTGVIPSSMSKSADTPAPVDAPQAAAPAPAAVPSEQPKTATAKKIEPARVASTEPAPRTAAASKPKPGICSNCGSVVSVDAVKQQGEGSGLGAVAGGVAGGVLGNQIGRGTGRTVATVVGVAGGAYAGHEIEKHVKSTNTYVVAVRMDDGTSRTFGYDTMPAYRAGDKVKVVEGSLVRQ